MWLPTRRRRPESDGAVRLSPGSAVGQDVGELRIEIEVPVLGARWHSGVGPLQERLQGPRRGLEQGFSLGELSAMQTTP